MAKGRGVVRRIGVWCVAALVASVVAVGPAQAGPFADVPDGEWFSTPVEWLADQEITTGTGDGLFSPDDFVTRAQMAAFLARFGSFAGDSPEAGFADVVAGSFYDAPVDWLLEHAITTGTSASTFSPLDNVTRAQMAAFLWRFAGRPASDAVIPFLDVPADTWFTEAVAWLVENEITTGTSDTTYSPDDFVTRAQMATFLWRMAGEPAVGEFGLSRVASMPLSASGGVFEQGDVVVSFGSLTDDGYVKVVVGEGGASLASLDGAISDDVEIVVSQAQIDGPIVVTVPIETIDPDDVELLVHVLNGDGDWEELAIAVVTSVQDGQMFATFILPAGVTLAPSSVGAGLSLFAAGDLDRVVTRVAARAVAPPTTTPDTTSTTTSTTPPTTTTTMPLEPVTLDTAALVTEYRTGVPAFSFVAANGGSGDYIAFRAPGLPPGLEIVLIDLDEECCDLPSFGEIRGTPTEAGVYSVRFEVEDHLGNLGVAIATITVVESDLDGSIEVVDRSSIQAYPAVSPDGSVLVYIDRPPSGPDELVVRSLDTGDELGIGAPASVGSSPRGRGHGVSVGGASVHVRYGDLLVVHDVVGDTATVIMDQVGVAYGSADHSFIAFDSRDEIDGEPIGFDRNEGEADAFLWHRETGTVQRLTSGETPSFVAGISGDGRYVLFISGDNPTGGIEPNGTLPDVYIYDRVDGVYLQVSPGTATEPTNRAAISADGSTVYFAVDDLVSVWDRATTAITLVADGDGFPVWTDSFFQSDDGRFAAFESPGPNVLPGAPVSVGSRVYFYDRDAGSLVRPTDERASNASRPSFGLSAAGSTMVMASSAGLDGQPNVGGVDVFLWDRIDGSFERITNGASTDRATFPGISPDGSQVWFNRNHPDGWLHIWTRPGTNDDPAAACPSVVAPLLRSHVAMTLWKLAGWPTPAQLGSDIFDDVPAGSNYDAAVGWVVEAGITTGTSPTTFEPRRGVTRAEYAVFVHRDAGEPAHSGSSPWTDVDPGRFYADATTWAADQGVAGTSPTTFGPSDEMTHVAAADWWSVLDPTLPYFGCPE